ncbi:MAG: hypothetical protein IPO21_05220 [Bacteroidales bacterium]|nr:hypothetical protein [Bacteroidales bacterium]
MKKNISQLIILISVFIIYGNTLRNEYALDDAIVITQNDFTKEGFSGIGKHLSNESFTGFFKEEKKLVSGGRYRPLSFITFSLEYEFFGENPHVSHFINIVLYILLSLLIFKILLLLFKEENQVWYKRISFWATMLFVFHPIHTEVVANIKGRDEILTFLGALAALYVAILYVKASKPKMQKTSCLMFVFFFPV